jgi:hypothetical protein
MEKAGPAFTMLDVKAGGGFVARGDPDVVAVFGVGGFLTESKASAKVMPIWRDLSMILRRL